MDCYEFFLCLVPILISLYMLIVIILDQFDDATFRLTAVAKKAGHRRDYY